MVGKEGINNQKVVVSSHPLSKSDVAHSVLWDPRKQRSEHK